MWEVVLNRDEKLNPWNDFILTFILFLNLANNIKE